MSSVEHDSTKTAPTNPYRADERNIDAARDAYVYGPQSKRIDSTNRIAFHIAVDG